MGRWLVRLLSLFLSFAVIGALVLAWGYAEFTKPGPLAQPATIVVEKGDGVEAIANKLLTAGVIFDVMVFAVGAKLTDKARKLKAGEFNFPAAISAKEALGLLEGGQTVVRKLTIVEGLSSNEIVEVLLNTEGLTGDISSVPAEGSLLPETYHFSLGDDRQALLSRMTQSMEWAAKELWEQRQPGLPLASMEEAIILASIVEKETGLARERGLVAGVFINRLRKGMRLQSDPTVAYGISPGVDLGRALSKSDLRTSTPFNTYRIDGLPPAPICNPGSAAIEAVLNPIETDYFYFVADGTGGHAFARTLDEHNHNVRAWRKIQAQQAQ